MSFTETRPARTDRYGKLLCPACGEDTLDLDLVSRGTLHVDTVCRLSPAGGEETYVRTELVCACCGGLFSLFTANHEGVHLVLMARWAGTAEDRAEDFSRLEGELAEAHKQQLIKQKQQRPSA